MARGPAGWRTPPPCRPARSSRSGRPSRTGTRGCPGRARSGPRRPRAPRGGSTPQLGPSPAAATDRPAPRRAARTTSQGSCRPTPPRPRAAGCGCSEAPEAGTRRVPAHPRGTNWQSQRREISPGLRGPGDVGPASKILMLLMWLVSPDGSETGAPGFQRLPRIAPPLLRPAAAHPISAEGRR